MKRIYPFALTALTGLLLTNPFAAIAAESAPGWRPLFNGNDLQGWMIQIRGQHKNEDPTRLVQIEAGALHFYQDAAAGSSQPFGYIATEKEYSHYRLRLEFKWGEKKFAPRTKSVRDSGLLYHVTPTDKVWPDCVEYQIQEHDVGDIYVVSTQVTAPADPQTTNVVTTVSTNKTTGIIRTNTSARLKFLEVAQGGVPAVQGRVGTSLRVIRNPLNERAGWNTVEIEVNGDRATHWLNGEINNRCFEIKQSVAGNWVPLQRGRIALQLEGAEILYRNIEIQELPNPWLTPGKFYSEAQGKAKLAEFAKTYSDRAGWERRVQAIRAGILRGAGLETLPPRSELNPVRHSEKQRDGYTVENVAFESRPGFFVTGNLYRPLPLPRGVKHPAVLVTHGHSADPASGGRFRSGTQQLCGTLARAGAVVLAYDMVGYGEATQFEHKSSITLGLQLWNSIRAVDFLQSLPEVAGARIGITGESGGATQALLLAAVDDRIAVTVPVVMVSAHFFGGCACESGMPVHRSPEHETCNAEIAALAAPKPQLLISDGKDWTANVPEVEFPYIRNAYRLMSAEDKVENLHLPTEGHDYGPSKRAGAYAFLGKQLGLSLGRIQNAAGQFDEQPVAIQKREALLVFTASHPRPEHAMQAPEIIEAQFRQRGSANRQ